MGAGNRTQFTSTCKIKWYNFSLFAEPVQGYKYVWIIGDEHLTQAAGHLMEKREKSVSLFMERNYNIKLYMKNSLSLERSTVARLCSPLMEAIHENSKFPKLIIVSIYMDLIKDIDATVSYVFGALLHWLVTEFDKLVEIQKDRLPFKARKLEYPTFLWMSPPSIVISMTTTLESR